MNRWDWAGDYQLQSAKEQIIR